VSAAPGRAAFFGPAVDLLIVGGGASLALAVALAALGSSWLPLGAAPVVVALANNAHFGSSTVRLYGSGDALTRFPWLSSGFLMLSLAVATAGIAWPGVGGKALVALYLSWSPFHYAAQSYGIAVLGAFRGGWALSEGLRRALYWACLMPFGYALLMGLDFGNGLGLVLTPEAVHGHPRAEAAWRAGAQFFAVASFAVPLVVLALQAARSRALPPLLVPLVVVANAVWWIALPAMEAFVVATVAHSLQYLAVVLHAHLKERGLAEAAWRQKLAAMGRVYGASALLGYGLFQCLPFAFELYGFGFAESVLVVAAVVNLHHFIVDGFIWRVRPRTAQAA